MVQFNENTAAQGSVGLIPAGTLVWLAVSVRSIGPAKSSGVNQADMEFTVAGGPFTKRKVWAYITDPDDPGASEAAREMSGGALARMLEAVGVCKPGNPDSYRNPRIATFKGCIDTLVAATGAGRFVAARMTIEKGTGGYQDKNRPDFLSPNPNSGSKKAWAELVAAGTAGVAGAPAGAPPATLPAPAWGGQAAAAVTGAPAPVQPAPIARPSALSAPAWTTPGATQAPAAGQAATTLDDDIPF